MKKMPKFGGFRRPAVAPNNETEPGVAGSFRSIFSTFGLIVAAFLLAFLIKAYLLQPYVVDGQSMEPTLQNSDRLIVDKIPRTISAIDHRQYVPNRGDIIIFNEANLPGYIGSKQLIKRVIGLPGDRVVVKDGSITIYNAANPKGFNPDNTDGYPQTIPITQGSIDTTLGSSEIFVCGDNRANSEDSRYFGPVNTHDVVGKLILRILPLGNVKKF